MCPPVGMEDRWFARLTDVNPAGSFFSDYARLLRLLSGLSGRGLVRMAARAARARQEESRMRSLRTHPSVMEFVAFLRSVPEEDLPVVLSVISDEMFPDSEVSWFHANNIDPLINPVESVASVVDESRRVSQAFDPLGVSMPAPPNLAWYSDPVPSPRSGLGVGAVVFSQVLPGVAPVSPLPGVNSELEEKVVFVKISADDSPLAEVKFDTVAGVTVSQLSEAIFSAFGSKLNGIATEWFLNDGSPVTDPSQVVPFQGADCTLSLKLKRAMLEELHSREVLESLFPKADIFKGRPTDDSSNVRGEGSTSVNCLVSIRADQHHLGECRFLLPEDVTAQQLVEGLIRHYGFVLQKVEGRLLSATDRSVVPPECVLSNKFPTDPEFFLQLDLKDLVDNFSDEDLRHVFPDAKVFTVQQSSDSLIGESYLSDVSVTEAVPLQSAMPPDGVPRSKACPVKKASDPGEDVSMVRRAKLFLGHHFVMMRYVRVGPSTTVQEFIDPVLKLVPEKYRSLHCEVFVGDSDLLISREDIVLECLKPTEVTVCLRLSIDGLDRSQVSATLAILRSSLSFFDASDKKEQEFEEIVVEEGDNPDGSDNQEVPNNPRGSERPVTPPRFVRSSRPVFGPSGSAGSSRVRSRSPLRSRGAMAAAGNTERRDVGVSGRFTYQSMPALSQEQNEALDGFAKKVVHMLRHHEIRDLTVVFERDGADPLPVNSFSFDLCLRSMASTWKLLLPSLGRKWNMGVRSDPEFGYRSASVFIQAFDTKDDLQSEGGGKSKRNDSNRHERRERDRRRRGERAPTETKDDEDVNTGSYGTGKSHVVSVERVATMQGVVDFNVSPLNDSDLDEKMHLQEITSTTPLALGEFAWTGPSTDSQKVCDYPSTEGTNDYAGDLEIPSDYMDVDKGLETLVHPCVSPTFPWTQDAPTNEVAKLCPDTLEELLRGLLFSPLPIFGKVGILKKAFPLFVQTLQGSGDTWPYIVHPGSPDVCYQCLCVLPQSSDLSNCSHCGVPCVPPVFPDVINEGSDFPEINVLSRYVPRPQCILSKSGRFTVEGVVGPKFRDLLWSFFPVGFDGKCFMLWDGEPELIEGTHVVLFNGLVVGVWEKSPIFGYPFRGSSSALVRRPGVDDDVRVLDLFSGLGGWEHALQLISPVLGDGLNVCSDVVSVELEPVSARTLALNTGRVLVSADQCSSFGEDGVVVLGDVCDPTWYGLSICRPFTDVLWSAPCQPWSKAGNTLGFSAEDGILLAHAIGLILLFRPLRAAGENVAGLTDHPHWCRVKNLLCFLPHKFRVQTTDLKFLSPMARKRLFLLFQMDEIPSVIPHVDLKPRHWLDVGCGYLDPTSRDDTGLTDEQISKLSMRMYLPIQERSKSIAVNESDGPQVLMRRLSGPTLPTLVASYRFQCELPERNLMDRGILTWLVSENSGILPPRYLDQLEAVRLLGFPFAMALPSQECLAMKLLGNSVSPLQGAVALFRLFGGTELASLVKELKFRLYAQPKIQWLAKHHFGDFCRPSYTNGGVERISLSVRVWSVSCDSFLSALTGEPHFTTDLKDFVPIGSTTQVASCCPFFTEDALTYFLRFETVRVCLIADTVVKLCLSPLTKLCDLGCLIKGGVADLPGSFCDPLWVFSNQQVQIFLNKPLSILREVRFIFGDDVRLWPFQERISFFEAIEYVFPFGIAKHAQVRQNEERMPLESFPLEGYTYTVTFDPVLIEVPPFGPLWVDPLTKTGCFSDFLSWKFYHGRASVRLTANGKLVDPSKTICFSQRLGSLRGRIFALPGGVARTLTTILDQLASELVAHGHPKKDVEKKANEVYDALGHTECKRILDSRHVWPLLKSECTKAKVVLVPLSCRGNKELRDEVFEQDPWANYAENGKKGRARKTVEKVNKAVVKVDMSFFHSSKQPLLQIGLNQLLQGHPGLLVTDLEEFHPHFPTVLKSNTSVGAAGVLLVGASLPDLSVGSSARVTDCVVPGWIGSHSAAIRAVLLCCGDEDVETYHEVSLKVNAPPADHQVVQYHIFRDTCTKWDTLSQQGFEFFLKAIGFSQLMSISQTWSQNFYHRGKKTAAEDAEYFHGFLRAEIKVVPCLLKLGGYDGFFPSPRTLQRSNDPAYRVLHLRGFSLTDARAVLPSDAFGLTRSKQGYGMRLLAEKYSLTKAKLFPGSVDSSESDEGGTGKFHLLGVPSSVDRSTLKAALRTLKWQVKVSKSAGYRAWTVFSSADPPTRSFPLHKTTIVILRVDQSHQGPVLATSSKHQPGLKLQLPQSQSTKADIDLPSGVASKYSQLADQSHAKVTELENKVQKLADTLDQSQKDVSQRFEVVEQEVKTIGQQVTKQSADLDDKLQSMFDKLFANQKSCMDKLEKSNEQAITSLRSEYQTGYTELKEILSNSPKTRKVAGP